jgi:hypothetical protein
MNRRSFLALLSAAAALPKVAMAAFRREPKRPVSVVPLPPSVCVLAIAEERIPAGSFVVWTSYLPPHDDQRVPHGTVRTMRRLSEPVPVAGVTASAVEPFGVVEIVVKGGAMVRADG